MWQSPLHVVELVNALKLAQSLHGMAASLPPDTTDHLAGCLIATRVARRWIVQPRMDASGQCTPRQMQSLTQLDMELRLTEQILSALTFLASDVPSSSSTRVWFESTTPMSTE